MTGNQHTYKDYICYDILGHVPGIHTKAMFGGHGIYKNGIIFALIFKDQLYFKVDNTNKLLYEEHGSQPFSYPAKGKMIQLSYWEVPESVLEDPDTIEEWMINI